MEKRRPWEPSQEALDIEFQRKTLQDLRSHRRDFAEKSGVTYELDKGPDSIYVRPELGDFTKLSAHITETLETLNKMLHRHEKGFLFVAEEYNNGLKIHAVSSK